MDQDKIDFVTFAIGSVAERLGKSPAEIYRLFKATDMIDGYLVAAYGALHTFGREYLVNELLEVMQERGVKL